MFFLHLQLKVQFNLYVYKSNLSSILEESLVGSHQLEFNLLKSRVTSSRSILDDYKCLFFV